MDHQGRYGIGCGGQDVAHGGEPYLTALRPPRKGRARALLVPLLLASLLPFLAPSAAAAPRTRELKARGSWVGFEVKAPEQVIPYLFEVTAGCRYRLTVRCTTLERVLVEVGPGEATVWRADSRPPDPLPGTPGPTSGEGETAPAPPPPPDGPEAVVEWNAETDDVIAARVRGFSALTGRGKIRLQTLGADGTPVKAHRRLLAPGGTLAKVGSLWVGEPNRWDLVVDPGRTYELRTLPGTAGRIALAVVGSDDTVLASSAPTAAAPYPTLRFTVPEAVPLHADEPSPRPMAWHLEVVTAGGGGGTYGVRLRPDPPPLRDDDVAGPLPPPVSTGPVEGEDLTFGANPGDVAFLYLPRSSVGNPHWLQMQNEGHWVRLPHEPSATVGKRASMRTPEGAALVWFRPFVPATYRFIEPRAADPVFRVVPAADVPDAPLLLGTGHDPSVLARAHPTWKTIGVGVCMPGWDYLFVAVGRRRAGVSMRVKDVLGGTTRLRTRTGIGATRVAGLGPSLRFRVKAPTLVRLEVKGKKWEGYALLRRAGN